MPGESEYRRHINRKREKAEEAFNSDDGDVKAEIAELRRLIKIAREKDDGAQQPYNIDDLFIAAEKAPLDVLDDQNLKDDALKLVFLHLKDSPGVAFLLINAFNLSGEKEPALKYFEDGVLDMEPEEYQNLARSFNFSTDEITSILYRILKKNSQPKATASEVLITYHTIAYNLRVEKVFVSNPEIQGMAAREAVNYLKHGDFEEYQKFCSLFSLEKSKLTELDLKEAARVCFNIKMSANRSYKTAVQVAREFELDQEEIEKVVGERFIEIFGDSVSRETRHELANLLMYFPVPERLKADKGIQAKVFKLMEIAYNNEDYSNADWIRDQFSLPYASEDVFMEKMVCEWLDNENSHGLFRLFEKLGGEEKYLSRPAVREAGFRAMCYSIAHGAKDNFETLKIKEKFGFGEEEYKTAIQTAAREYMDFSIPSDLAGLCGYLKDGVLDKNELATPQNKERVGRGIPGLILQYPYSQEALELIFQLFDFSEKEIKYSLIVSVELQFSSRTSNYEIGLELIRNFHFTPDEIRQAVRGGLKRQFVGSSFPGVVLRNFSMMKELLPEITDEDVVFAAKEAEIDFLTKEHPMIGKIQDLMVALDKTGREKPRFDKEESLQILLKFFSGSLSPDSLAIVLECLKIDEAWLVEPDFKSRIATQLKASIIKDGTTQYLNGARQCCEKLGITARDLDMETQILEWEDEYFLSGHLKFIQDGFLFFFFTNKRDEIQKKLELVKKLAVEIGITKSSDDDLNSKEWREVYSKLKMVNFVLNKDTKRELRELIMHANGDSVRNQYTMLMVYLRNDDDARDIVWSYLGQRNKHDLLQNVPSLVRSAMEAESRDGKDRRRTVINLFRQAGMGTGHSAFLLKDIMSHLFKDFWEKLETESSYPGKKPCLADPNELDLARIKNEIKLFQNPQIKQEIASLPEGSSLQAYALALLEHPDVNVEAIRNFVSRPSDFFGSRTGAGENISPAKDLLATLEPRHWPSCTSEMARDAIVEGTFDRLNGFPFMATEWHSGCSFESVEQMYAETFARSEGSAEVYARLLKLIGSHTKESGEDFKVVWREYKARIFSEFFKKDGRYSVVCEYLKKKGDEVIAKALDYMYKQKRAEVEKLIKKYEKNLKDNQNQASDIEKHLASLREYLAQIDKEKDDKKQTLSDLIKNLDNENVSVFWKMIFETGWLDKMDLGKYASRITGEKYGDEEDWQKIIFSEALERSEDDKLSGDLQLLIQNLTKTLPLTWYRAEILKPSDPMTALAGTESGQCDAFGHGKKAHFMINPATTQFILMESRGGHPGEWGIGNMIAQSTLTLAKCPFKTPEQRQAFFDVVAKDSGKIGGVISQAGFSDSAELLKAFVESEAEICLDSVEVSQNVRTRLSPEAIFVLLKKSFYEMRAQNEFYNARIIAGRQFSYLGDIRNQIDNHSLWLAPLAYSDNLGERFSKAVLIKESDSDHAPSEKETEPGLKVRPARGTDAMAIGIMEDIAFRRTGGEGYITGIVSMTSELLGSVLRAEQTHTVPLSYVATEVDQEGREYYRGYLIAFERGNDKIYITDTATTGETKGAGGLLLAELLQNVKNDPKLKKKRIIMDCRGKTSALAISKPNNRQAIEALGYQVQGPTYEEVERMQTNSLINFQFIPV